MELIVLLLQDNRRRGEAALRGAPGRKQEECLENSPIAAKRALNSHSTQSLTPNTCHVLVLISSRFYTGAVRVNVFSHSLSTLISSSERKNTFSIDNTLMYYTSNTICIVSRTSINVLLAAKRPQLQQS